MNENDDAQRQYALRILPRAERDIEAQTVRLADLIGPEVALAWHKGLFDAIATLAHKPRRCAAANEKNRFKREVYQLLYRRTSAGVAWRVLFTVSEESEEAPTVNLIHIRHGAQRLLTRTEARAIEAQE